MAGAGPDSIMDDMDAPGTYPGKPTAWVNGQTWLTLGVLALWLPATYVSLFLAFVRYLEFSYFAPGPPDGVGCYMMFSPDQGTNRFLATVFWPPVHVIEHYRIALYAPVEPAWSGSYRMGRNGWAVCLGTHDPPVDSCAVSLAMVEAMLTGFLVYRFYAFVHGRRQAARPPVGGVPDAG